MLEFKVNRVVQVVDGRRRVVTEAIGRQPGWVTRAALLAFVFVLLLPLALLLLAALAVAVVIFGALAVAHGAWRAVTGGRGDFARRSGRENVRVIERD